VVRRSPAIWWSAAPAASRWRRASGWSRPLFPARSKAEAEKGAAFLDLLRQEKELNWTFLSPSALFVEGERTGKFRLGTDQLLTAEDGKSWISFEDFAVAMADEIERPAHMRQRFTVGY
jgi:uncharacterized protein